MCNPYCQDIQIRRCEWSQPTKWPKVNRLLKIVNYFTWVRHSLVHSWESQKLIWIDTQGSLTHIVEIFRFGNVSGDRGNKMTKRNRRLKIVNYFTCVRHSLLYIVGTPKSWFEWNTQGSVTHCQDIQIRRCEWSQTYQMAQTKSTIKIVNYFTCGGTPLVHSWDPQKLIWIDTQGSLTHIVEIFKFGKCEWWQGNKMTKSKSPIKIVNYLHVCSTPSCT